MKNRNIYKIISVFAIITILFAALSGSVIYADENIASVENTASQPPATDNHSSEIRDNSTLWNTITIVGSIVCFIIAVLLAIRSANKKFGKL